MTNQYEAKSMGVVTLVSASWLCFRNAVAGWTLFVSSFIVELLHTVFTAAVFFLMAEFVTTDKAHGLPPDYGGFVVIGFLGVTLFNSLCRSFYSALSTGYWGGYWEFFGSFPLGIPAYLIGSALFNLFSALVSFVLMLGVGACVFGVTFPLGSALATGVTIAVAIMPAIAIGLCSASMFFLINAKGWREPVSWSLELLSALVAGTYFPREHLPDWLQTLGEWIPHTHILDTLRLSIMQRAPLGGVEVQAGLIHISLWGLAMIPIGVALFAWGMRLASRQGQFTRWV